MKLSLIIVTLSSLLLSAVVHANKETSSLRRGLNSGNKNGANDYFALISNTDQEVPACMSSALGNVIAMVRDDLFCIRLSFDDGLSGPELFSHVHGPAAVGESGPVIFTIDTTSTKTQCFELTKDQKKDLDDELWYFNIQSEECPNGAIRSQILPLESNVGTIVKNLRQNPSAEAVSEALLLNVGTIVKNLRQNPPAEAASEALMI
jgi:hypothetical protein